MQRAGVVVIGAFVAAGFLAGCATPRLSVDGNASATAVSGYTISNGLITYTPDIKNKAYSGMSARFEGELTFENNCLGVDGVPFIFPAELTVWDGSELTVEGQSYELGETVVFGGGEIAAKSLPADIEDECGNATFVLVSGLAS